MNQSNRIFFFVFAAFFVFITVRGELPKYMGFLLASPSTAPGSGGIQSSPISGTTTAGVGSDSTALLRAIPAIAAQVAPYAAAAV